MSGAFGGFGFGDGVGGGDGDGVQFRVSLGIDVWAASAGAAVVEAASMFRQMLAADVSSEDESLPWFEVEAVRGGGGSEFRQEFGPV
jgi:hypothetical protein